MAIVTIGASINDTYVSESAPTTNYVGSPLQVRNNVSSSVEEISLINFNLSGETTTNLGKVFLYFYVVSGGDANTSQFTAKRITSSWTGGSVTWNTQPSYTATDAGTVTVDSSDGVWYYINVTEIVKTIIGGTNYGISLHDTSASQDVSTVIMQEGFANEAYLKLYYVMEDCQESGTIFTGSKYFGYGDIYHKNLVSGPYVSLCDITPPWTSTPIVDELLTEDVPETYSSGTQRYVVTMHDAFIGVETKSAEFTECWYTDDGKRYVKITGSNSALGNNWTNSWKTMGHGFQNIPSGKDLYVEEGLYGGETLSNFNPPQTMNMYIQPIGHTEAQCNVWVSDDDAWSTGNVGGAASWYPGVPLILIDTTVTVPFTGKMHAFGCYKDNSGESSARVVIYRGDATYFNFIAGSDTVTLSQGSHDYLLTTPIDVQGGDIIALMIYGSNVGFRYTGSVPYSIYWTGTSNYGVDLLISELSTANGKDLAVFGRGFK